MAPVQGAKLDMDELGLTAEERHVARLVDGTRSIEDIVFSTGAEANEVYVVLAALLALGHAQVVVRGIEGIEVRTVRPG